MPETIAKIRMQNVVTNTFKITLNAKLSFSNNLETHIKALIKKAKTMPTTATFLRVRLSSVNGLAVFLNKRATKAIIIRVIRK